jgi:hypothetical protein
MKSGSLPGNPDDLVAIGVTKISEIRAIWASARREALVRALRNAGNNAVSYFITMAGHASFEPETDARLRTIANELPPMTPTETD